MLGAYAPANPARFHVTEFTSHVPGSFCWAELSTTDQKAAVAFYRDLFGWSVNDQPIGPDDVYSMLQLDGRDIGAAYTMRAEERQMGAPPHWNLYVAVANADETAARAQELGGTVLAPAFDVMDAGRMAIIQDPAGAIFEVWQPGRHIGARVLAEPGALCWSELSTRDPVAAERFYTRLFGWTSKPSGGDAAMA
jgi:predicted enzyme related to lactoylglutathione lyase